MRAPNFKPCWTVSVHFATETEANDFAHRLTQAKEQDQLPPLKSSLLMSRLRTAQEIDVEQNERL